MKNNGQQRIPFYQVDAFSNGPFTGNPAAVCLLDAWPDDKVLQRIATENNLSETGFVIKQGDDFGLRWFTPAVEVDLCGHATLAAASVLLSRNEAGERMRFHTRSGVLTVTACNGVYTLDFPLVTPSGSPHRKACSRRWGFTRTQAKSGRHPTLSWLLMMKTSWIF